MIHDTSCYNSRSNLYCTERLLSDELKQQQQSTDDNHHHHLIDCHQDHQHIDEQLSALSLQVDMRGIVHP